MLRYNSHCDFFGGRKLHLLYISVSSRPFIPPRCATNPLLCDRFRPPFCSIVFPVSLSNICDDSELCILETVRFSQRGSRGCRWWLKLKALGKIFGETSPLDFQNFTRAQVTKNNIPFISSETHTSFALLVSLGLYHIRLVNSHKPQL
jgi:hypothetical protein